MEQIVYSTCLIPDNNGEQLLNKIINSLAQKYGAYPFIPHLTIYGAVKGMTLEEMKSFVDESLIGIRPFKVKVKKAGYSDEFIKTLFLDCEMNESLQHIYTSLKVNLGKFKDYEFKPHLSLIYKNNMPIQEKEEIIRSIKMPGELTFNRCTLISASKPITQEADVLGWRINYDKTF